jgi:outer membrane protein OmpA-like peptidoglycan-associated protein
MKLRQIVPMIAAATLMAGCAANYDVASVAATAPTGDAFTQALHKNYVERAKFEVGEHDWESVDFFNRRAKLASEGKSVIAQNPSDRALTANRAEIEAAHSTLAAALATTAPADNPAACGAAQAWLEHWMEQQEEGHQADDIAMTRNGFMSTMPDCKATTAVTSKPAADPVVVKTFTVYFGFDQTDLSNTGMRTLADAAEAQKDLKPTLVSVAGHTDTAGSDEYNDALAAKRATIVADELNSLGVAAKVLGVKSHGENRTAVSTGDNVNEPKNRRVEIYFQK